MNTFPCSCSHSTEDHGHDPQHLASTACSKCACPAYDAEPVPAGQLSRAMLDLVAQYKSRPGMSEYEKARLEGQLWDLAGPSIRQHYKTGRAPWLKQVLGLDTIGEAHLRTALLCAGSDVDALWTRVHGDPMATSTAVKLYRSAKQLAARTNINIRDAIMRELADYDALPVSIVVGGNISKRRNAGRLPLLKELGKVREEAPKTFFGKLRVQIGEYVGARMQDCDPIVRDRIWNEFDRDLQVLVEEYSQKIYGATRHERGLIRSEVSRRQVVDACATLSMDPPRGSSAPNLKAARRQQRKLARLYHPDSNGGNEGLRPKYEAVNNAYLLLERYARGFGPRAKLDVIPGGRSGEEAPKNGTDHGNGEDR